MCNCFLTPWVIKCNNSSCVVSKPTILTQPYIQPCVVDFGLNHLAGELSCRVFLLKLCFSEGFVSSLTQLPSVKRRRTQGFLLPFSLLREQCDPTFSVMQNPRHLQKVEEKKKKTSSYKFDPLFLCWKNFYVHFYVWQSLWQWIFQYF